MLYLHGLGHFHPENELDNRFFEELDIGTDEAWITSRVGIEHRRTVLPLDYIRTTRNADPRAAVEAAVYSTAQTGARAATMAIERAGISPNDIGLVIAGGCSPDHCIPTEAATVALALGIECAAIDMHSACSTFGAQLHFVRTMGAAAPDYVLCVQPENTTRVTDYSDRSTCILFGDASAAAVVSTKHPARARIEHSQFGGAPSGAMDVVIPRMGYFGQSGSKVQKFAIKRMGALYRECQAAAAGDVVFVGHQANLTMLNSIAKRCDVPPELHWHNIVNFGNQAAAGAPAVASQHWDDFQAGMSIATVVVGAGLSWSSLLIEVQ